MALLGPSTPMLPDLFADTPVTHLGGVRIIDAAQIPPIVSAGGGIRAMRPYLEMTNLFTESRLIAAILFLMKKSRLEVAALSTCQCEIGKLLTHKIFFHILPP